MFKKYNDTPATIAMGLISIGLIFWLGLFFIAPESALSDPAWAFGRHYSYFCERV